MGIEEIVATIFQIKMIVAFLTCDIRGAGFPTCAPPHLLLCCFNFCPSLGICIFRNFNFAFFSKSVIMLRKSKFIVEAN